MKTTPEYAKEYGKAFAGVITEIDTKPSELHEISKHPTKTYTVATVKTDAGDIRHININWLMSAGLHCNTEVIMNKKITLKEAIAVIKDNLMTDKDYLQQFKENIKEIVEYNIEQMHYNVADEQKIVAMIGKSTANHIVDDICGGVVVPKKLTKSKQSARYDTAINIIANSCYSYTYVPEDIDCVPAYVDDNNEIIK